MFMGKNNPLAEWMAMGSEFGYDANFYKVLVELSSNDFLLQFNQYKKVAETEGVKCLTEQIRLLKRRFPQLQAENSLDYALNVVPRLALPIGAEGWVAIPKWHAIENNYTEAFNQIIPELAPTIYKGNENKPFSLDDEKLRYNKKSAIAMQRIEISQPAGDIIIFPAQMGRIQSGRKRSVVERRFSRGEFFLPPFEMACIILTHDKLFSTYYSDMRHLLCACGYYFEEYKNHEGKIYHHKKNSRVIYWEEASDIHRRVFKTDAELCCEGFNEVWEINEAAGYATGFVLN